MVFVVGWLKIDVFLLFGFNIILDYFVKSLLTLIIVGIGANVKVYVYA